MVAVYACDIGGSKLLCGLVTADGQILDIEKTALLPDITMEQIEKLIEDFYNKLCARNPKVEVKAGGMTIPGLADSKNGMWVYACFSGISDYPVAERMEKKLGIPITIANDVNACSWAEKIYGVCKHCDDYLWVTVSNGVGGGLVLNGKLYEGAFGGAGEFGHVIVEKDGLMCPCGHKGCMEAMAAGPAISKRYELLTGKKASAAEIAMLAKAGDSKAIEVFRKTGTYIGIGLGKVASMLNLSKYVLGGGVMQSFELMEEDIRKAFNEEAFERPNAKVEIMKTALQYEAGLLGAAAIVWQPPT